MNELQTMEDKSSYLSSNNFEHYYRIANMLASSQFAPKAFIGKPQDCLIAMEFGRSVGLAPMAAIQNIAVINGKPCLYGDGMLAVCQGHPGFEDIKENQILDTNGEVSGYECVVKRKGRSPVARIFTIRDATVAGLWGKGGPWKQYPGRMLQMRARGFALRDTFSDALSGISLAEEVEDYQIKDITPKNSNEIERDVKSLIDKNKTQVIGSSVTLTEESQKQINETELETVVVNEKKELINLDEMAVVKDIIKENKVNQNKIKTLLDKYNVEHIEHLESKDVDNFISDLIEGAS